MESNYPFSDPGISQGLVREISLLVKGPVRLMEVCGTHTVNIFKYGIRSLMPSLLDLVSGPGCPVCVTSQKDIDKIVALAKFPNVGILTFGDMIRVPGSEASLRDAMAQGADVRMVYSSMDTIKIAQAEPQKTFVFLAIGFETTAPLIAATIKRAKELSLRNLKFLSLHKLLPPALKVLFEGEGVKIDGLICPGHVSAIIGALPYVPVTQKGIPCVITGFEPVDILQGIWMLLRQVHEKRALVEIQYSRVVRPEGNPKALAIMGEVFERCDSEWRGLGTIGLSGLRIRDPFGDLDAERVFQIESPPSEEPKGCRCGEVLKGILKPNMCKMFGTFCRPDNPLGPCMVSSEGSCAAYFHYTQVGQMGDGDQSSKGGK